MSKNNFERMLQLADEVFDAKSDSAQIQVNEEVLNHLQEIHPACVSGEENENGPIAWMLLVPTTQSLMDLFLSGKISEQLLYEQTSLNVTYDAIYLCSAMVLPEYRRKGLAKKLLINAIASISKDHPIKNLFVWTFSKEGLLLSQAIAEAVNLPLLIKK
jgi:ribosomal protein S18 acetylase RimI-like enzyme